MRIRRMLACGAVVALLCAGLGGCSDDSDADPEPNFTSAASGSESPSPSESTTAEAPAEPTPPAAMANFDEAGAKAFAEFYWEVVSYAQATGDTGLLATLELPGCGVCQGGREDIEKAYSDGLRIVDGEITARAGRATGVGRADTDEVLGYDVRVRLVYDAGTRVDAKGNVVQRQAAGELRMLMSVYNDSEKGWRLGEWER